LFPGEVSFKLLPRFRDFSEKTQMATAILIGLAVTSAALIGRAAVRTIQRTSISEIRSNSSNFIKGGFDAQMSVREAQQILAIKNLNKAELKKMHRSVMLANHPDKGGSPYLASKINEAKDLLDKTVN
jgi:DnaJ homolog subfamily C member 19